MTADDRISDRLLEQRMRNRVIESVEIVAGGDVAVQRASATEYFELFYDYIADDHPWDWRHWSTFTTGEVDALEALLHVVDEARGSVPGQLSKAGLIESGWPTQVQPLAVRVLAIMLARGRYREDMEQAEPSP